MKKNMLSLVKRIGVSLLAGVLAFGAPVYVKAAEGTMNEDGNLTIKKFDTAPTLDGKVSVEEWGEKIFTITEGEKFISKLDQNGTQPAPFTADIYLGYDNQKFYIGAVAQYETHKNEALLPSDMWQGDCMQIQISAVQGAERNEMGFTDNSLTKKQQAVAWTTIVPFSMEAGEGKDYNVVRDGSTTVYEIALPVSQFSSSVTELADGSTIPFSLAFPMSGGGFYEFKNGIVQEKDITKAALVGLGAEPSAQVAPPADTAATGLNVSTNLMDSKTDTANREVPGTIEAEDYNELYGKEIKAEECSEGTQNLGFTNDGDYMVYQGVNFKAIPDTFSIRTAGAGTPTVTVKLDSIDGPTIAEVPVVATGEWQTFTTNTVDLQNKDAITGTHDVFVLINGGMNVNWISFDGGEVAEVVEVVEPTVEPTAEPTAEVTEEPSEPATSNHVDSSSNKPVIIVIIVIAVAVVAGVLVFAVKKKEKK